MEEVAQDFQDVFAEDDDGGQRGGGVERDAHQDALGGQALVAGQPLGQFQVAAAADGQELGQPLDDAQDQRAEDFGHCYFFRIA